MLQGGCTCVVARVRGVAGMPPMARRPDHDPGGAKPHESGGRLSVVSASASVEIGEFNGDPDCNNHEHENESATNNDEPNGEASGSTTRPLSRPAARTGSPSR